MAQAWIDDHIVRTVSPSGKEVEYFIVGTNNPPDAKQKVKNWLVAQKKGDWTVEEPKKPRKL